MSKKTEWEKTTNVLFACSFLPMTQQRKDFINQYLSLLNSLTFTFKMAPTGSIFFQCGANFSHLAKVVAQEKKYIQGEP